MRVRSIAMGLVLLAVPTTAVAQEVIPMDVHVKAVGKGTEGTVVEVAVMFAPEDRALVGNALDLRTTLSSNGGVIEDLTGVVAVGEDGVARVKRDWAPGSYDLSVWVSSRVHPAIGFSTGQLEVPGTQGTALNTADFQSSPEAEPPNSSAVHFLDVPNINSFDALHLEVAVPPGTAEVEFFHDSKMVDRRKRPPWSTRVSTREIVQQSRYRAVALDGSGRYLGEDVIVINPPPGESGIEILVAPASASVQGRLPVTVAITDRIKTLRVSLYIDDKLASSWQACPCVTDVAIKDFEDAAVLTAEVVDLQGNRFVEVVNSNGLFSGTVRVDLVELQVQVFDSHKVPVTGLDATDFSVFEDGTEVEIAGFGTAADQPLSVLLAVDSSGSMSGIFPQVRKAVEVFCTELLEPGDRAALIRFASEIDTVVSWSSDPSDITEGLDKIVPGGYTILHDAIINSLIELQSLRGRKAVVMLSDGYDTSSFASFSDAMWFSQSMRVPLFIISLRKGDAWRVAKSSDPTQVRNRHQITTLAQKSGGNAYFQIPVTELSSIYSSIAQILRSQYVLWYPPPPSVAGEFNSIEVKVAKPNLKVRTISGYYTGR